MKLKDIYIYEHYIALHGSTTEIYPLPHNQTVHTWVSSM